MQTPAAEVRAQLIRAAIGLFRTQGLRDTSPLQIVGASGARMRQFYYHFKNKQGIARAVLHYCFEAIESGTAPINCDVRSWGDLNRWFFAQAEYQQRYDMRSSCLLGAIATGVTEEDELVRQDLCRVFDLIAKKLEIF